MKQPLARIRLALLPVALLAMPLLGGARPELYLTGPSLSKHFRAWNQDVHDFHWGLGVECYRQGRRWFFGGNGHLMFNDSHGRVAWWLGAAGGLRFGSGRRLWLAPALMAGVIRKHEFHDGRVAPFALPYLALGWKRIGLNLVLIPAIRDVTRPILLVQIKARIGGNGS